MMEVLSLQLRQNVLGQLYQENMLTGKPYTTTHFVAMRIPRRTICRIIEVMERTWSTEGVAGSGPPASKLPHTARKRMAKAACNKVGITARKLCRKYGVASSFVTKVLKEGVKCYKGQKGSKSSPELVSRPKKCCRAMVRNHCKPSSQTELVLRKDIPQNVPQLAQSKICGLHLRRSCTVVAERPKTRSSRREERESVCELDWDVVRTMMAKVKTRLRNAVDKSPLSPLKFHVNTPGAI